MVQNPPANAGGVRHEFDPGSGRSLGRGHNNPLEYSCLENPMDREAWQATVHAVAKSQTRLKQLSPQTQPLLPAYFYCSGGQPSVLASLQLS